MEISKNIPSFCGSLTGTINFSGSSTTTGLLTTNSFVSSATVTKLDLDDMIWSDNWKTHYPKKKKK